MNNKITLLQFDDNEWSNWNADRIRQRQFNVSGDEIFERTLNNVKELENIFLDYDLLECFDIFTFKRYSRDYSFDFINLHTYNFIYDNIRIKLTTNSLRTSYFSPDGLIIDIENGSKYELRYSYSINWIRGNKEKFANSMKQILKQIHEVYHIEQ